MDTDKFTPLAYTVEAALAVTGIGRTKLYEEIGAGRLVSRKVGARTLILARDLEAWLSNLPVEPQQEAAA